MDNLYEISSLKAPLFELSEKAVNGRRNVRFVLHQIFENSESYQDNGISWQEKYTNQNQDSAVNMSITAALIDREYPTDHGFTEITESGLPVFENASIVGHTTKAAIQQVDINGISTKCLVCDGIIDEMRFPKFVEWLQSQIVIGSKISGSVEISAKTRGKQIEYDGGWKELGRIPSVYDYSGFSIITVQPADQASILLELNANKKGSESMDKEISDALNTLGSKFDTFNETNKKIETLNTSLEAKTTELNTIQTELSAKISESADFKAELEAANARIKTLETQNSEWEAKYKELQAACKKKELNEAIKDFNEKDLETVKELITAFNADPSSIEINTIVDKLKVNRYDTLMAEINSKKGNPKDTELDLMYYHNFKPFLDTDYSSLF